VTDTQTHRHTDRKWVPIWPAGGEWSVLTYCSISLFICPQNITEMHISCFTGTEGNYLTLPEGTKFVENYHVKVVGRVREIIKTRTLRVIRLEPVPN
jgi:hypothetical protein